HHQSVWQRTPLSRSSPRTSIIHPLRLTTNQPTFVKRTAPYVHMFHFEDDLGRPPTALSSHSMTLAGTVISGVTGMSANGNGSAAASGTSFCLNGKRSGLNLNALAFVPSPWNAISLIKTGNGGLPLGIEISFGPRPRLRLQRLRKFLPASKYIWIPSCLIHSNALGSLNLSRPTISSLWASSDPLKHFVSCLPCPPPLVPPTCMSDTSLPRRRPPRFLALSISLATFSAYVHRPSCLDCRSIN
ncbi:hypothetical protein EV363DRAFT_1164245, partial [Boletus edulis]